MKNKEILVSIILAVVIIGGAVYYVNKGTTSSSNQVANNEQAAGEYINLSAREFKETLDKAKGNPDVELIDVRTPAEYTAGHIAGAKEIDFYAPDFAQKIASLDRNKIYFIYCRSGHRSGETLKLMQKLGFKKVYNLEHGFNSWLQEGLPVEK